MSSVQNPLTFGSTNMVTKVYAVLAEPPCNQVLEPPTKMANVVVGLLAWSPLSVAKPGEFPGIVRHSVYMQVPCGTVSHNSVLEAFGTHAHVCFIATQWVCVL